MNCKNDDMSEYLTRLQFDAYCRKALRHALIDYVRMEKQKNEMRNTVIPFSSINEELNTIMIAEDLSIKIPAAEFYVESLNKHICIYNETLADGLAALSPKLRDELLMYFFENMNTEEIGTELGKSFQAVSQNRKRALAKLAEVMAVGDKCNE